MKRRRSSGRAAPVSWAFLGRIISAAAHPALYVASSCLRPLLAGSCIPTSCSCRIPKARATHHGMQSNREASGGESICRPAHRTLQCSDPSPRAGTCPTAASLTCEDLMNAPRSKSEGSVPLSREMWLEAVCVRFEAAWTLGGVPRIDDFLSAATGAERGPLLKELIRLDVSHRRQRGEAVSAATYLQHFPELDPTWLAREVLAETLVSAGPAQGIGGNGAADRAVAGRADDRGGATGPRLRDPRRAGPRRHGRRLPGQERAAGPARSAEGGEHGAARQARGGGAFPPRDPLGGDARHNNVVQAYSAVQSGESLLFAMEYVDGEDLDKVVQRQGPLPIPYACHYVSQAAMGCSTPTSSSWSTATSSRKT